MHPESTWSSQRRFFLRRLTFPPSLSRMSDTSLFRHKRKLDEVMEGFIWLSSKRMVMTEADNDDEETVASEAATASAVAEAVALIGTKDELWKQKN